MTAQSVLGQPLQTPPRRSCTTPSSTAQTSSAWPSSWRVGATSSVRTRVTRAFRLSSCGTGILNSSCSGESVSLFDIAVQLLRQVGDAGEGTCITQPRQKVDSERLAVQVAAEVDQMNLDLASLFPKGRVGANIGRAGPGRAAGQDADGVNAIARSEGLHRLEVGRRETEHPAPLLSGANRAVKAVGPAQQAGRLGNGTALQLRPDSAARNNRPV